MVRDPGASYRGRKPGPDGKTTMVKFSVGAETLGTLVTRTSTESDDLRSLVQKFVAAAEPLEDVMSGEAKVAFDRFKGKSDEIAGTLHNALVGICGSIDGQNKSFITGAQEGADAHRQGEGAANFDAAATVARFGPQ